MLLLLAIPLLGLIVLGFFLWSGLRPNEIEYSCTLPSRLQCGFQGQSPDGSTLTFSGQYDGVTKKSENFYISMVFPLSDGLIIQEDFLLPNKIKPQVGEYKFNDQGKITSVRSRARDIIQLQAVLKKGNTISVYLRLPKEEELIEAKRLVGDDKYLSCFKVHDSFFKYIKNPTLISKFLYLFEKYRTQCNPVVIDIRQYERSN